LARELTQVLRSDAIPAGESVLDYGCGNRPYEPLLRSKFRKFVGADFPGNPDADVTIGPRGELPLPDQSVDCVISSQVLEHVESPSFYLSEAYRCLKPDGCLLLSTHGTWRYHPDPSDYWRWTIDGLKLEVTRSGFDVWTMRSVMGMASSALQLWQDATAQRLPRMVRTPYIWLLQSLILNNERSQIREPRPAVDASVYVVLAKKRAQRDLPAAAEEQHGLTLAIAEADAHVPAGTRVVVVDQNEIGPALLPGREVVPFLERNGIYWGLPADDREALREFKRLRDSGAKFVVVAWPAFWWLEYYKGWARHLGEYPRVLENERLIIIDIRDSWRTYGRGY
jgi:SAM-dependent methyltransferase